MPEIALPIASIAACANGLILLFLTVCVIRIRRRDGVVLGDNDDRVMTKAIRGQANAAEQMPLALILLALSELQGGNPVVLGLFAVLFTLGRALHATYFAIDGTTWRLRFYGMLMTLTAQIGLLLALLVTVLT